MKHKSLNLESSEEWLKEGKILIHPTESVWGLGCDAFNPKAVNDIFKIKKRSKNKSFILLTKSLESVENYLQDINKEETEVLKPHIIEVKPMPINIIVIVPERLQRSLNHPKGIAPSPISKAPRLHNRIS